jgi:hypothetical protein
LKSLEIVVVTENQKHFVDWMEIEFVVKGFVVLRMLVLIVDTVLTYIF